MSLFAAVGLCSEFLGQSTLILGRVKIVESKNFCDICSQAKAGDEFGKVVRSSPALLMAWNVEAEIFFSDIILEGFKIWSATLIQRRVYSRSPTGSLIDTKILILRLGLVVFSMRDSLLEKVSNVE